MNTKEKIILGIVGLVVVAGVALAASGVVTFGETPDAVFKKMADAKASITSSHVDMTVSGTITGATASEGGQFSFTVKGAAGKTETGQSADFHIAASGAESGGTNLALEADARMLDRVFYVRPTRLPPVPFIDPAMIMNKWFSIDPVAMYKEFGNADKAAELESALSGGSKMPKEFNEKAYQLVTSERLVSNISAKGSEVVSGVAAAKYELTIDISKLPNFIEKYTDLYNSYAAGAGLSKLPVKTFTDEDKAVLAGISLSPVSVWIGKADSLPYKANFTLTITDATKLPGQLTGPQGTITFDAVFSDYNKPVTVEKPAGVTPIQDLMKSLMGGLQ